jgi:hypothetical protein
VLPAGSSRALRVLLPGHIQLEKRFRDIAIAGKNEKNKIGWKKIQEYIFRRNRSTRTKIARRTGCLFFLKKVGKGKATKN